MDFEISTAKTKRKRERGEPWRTSAIIRSVDGIPAVEPYEKLLSRNPLRATNYPSELNKRLQPVIFASPQPVDPGGDPSSVVDERAKGIPTRDREKGRREPRVCIMRLAVNGKPIIGTKGDDLSRRSVPAPALPLRSRAAANGSSERAANFPPETPRHREQFSCRGHDHRGSINGKQRGQRGQENGSGRATRRTINESTNRQKLAPA